MNCENKFCIYYENHVCILGTIDMNALGCCDSCIYIDLDESVLREARSKTREKFEMNYEHWKNKSAT